MAADQTIGGPWPQARFVSVDVFVSRDSILEGEIDGETPLLLPEDKAEGCRWVALIELTTGFIQNWPPIATAFSMRVCVKDSGTYVLLDRERLPLVRLVGAYVPREIFPGGNEDYLSIEIGSDGRITNWPKMIDTWDFDLEETRAQAALPDGSFVERPKAPQVLGFHENPYEDALSQPGLSEEERMRLRILARRRRLAQEQQRLALEELRKPRG